MASHADKHAEVIFFLKTPDVKIRISARAGHTTFREALADVGTLATPLSQGEIVAIELLTPSSHEITVPPAALIQLDERITKQHSNKTFRLVWRDRLSAESDDDEVLEGFVIPEPIKQPIPAVPRHNSRLARADSDVTRLMRASTPPTTPRRSSLSFVLILFYHSQ